MSRLLIVTLNYAPEPTGFAPQTTALAEHLVSAGHDVTVVTGFPFAPRWTRSTNYRGAFARREEVNGVHVQRVSHFIPTKPGRAVERMLMEGSFALIGFALLVPYLFSGKRCDLVIYVGAQPALAWLARILAVAWRIPYIVKITDLAAQAAVDVGMIDPGLWGTVLQRVEFSAYRRARAAIVLCDSFEKALTANGFPVDSIHMIRDSVDLSAIRPFGDGNRFRRRFGISSGEFVVLYAGSLGLKQGLLDIVDAAELASTGSSPVRWVLVGEGEMRNALAERIASSKLGDRILLLTLQPESDLSDMFAAADLLLLSQLRSVKDTVIPSKLLMYMAAGRPIVAALNSASQAAAIVREARSGVVVPPEDPRALAAAVAELRDDPLCLDLMAVRGRAYAEQHFDRRVVLLAQQRVIEAAIEPCHRGASEPAGLL